MVAALAFFLFGFLAGFVLIRLRRDAPAPHWRWRSVRALAFVVMGAAFTLSLALFGWALLG